MALRNRAADRASAKPCLVCGSTVEILRSDRPQPDDDVLIDALRVCSNPDCLSNGGATGAGPAV